MSTGNIAYLSMVVAVAVIFILVVGYCSIDRKSNR